MILQRLTRGMLDLDLESGLKVNSDSHSGSHPGETAGSPLDKSGGRYRVSQDTHADNDSDPKGEVFFPGSFPATQLSETTSSHRSYGNQRQTDEERGSSCKPTGDQHQSHGLNSFQTGAIETRGGRKKVGLFGFKRDRKRSYSLDTSNVRSEDDADDDVDAGLDEVNNLEFPTQDVYQEETAFREQQHPHQQLQQREQYLQRREKEVEREVPLRESLLYRQLGSQTDPPTPPPPPLQLQLQLQLQTPPPQQKQSQQQTQSQVHPRPQIATPMPTNSNLYLHFPSPRAAPPPLPPKYASAPVLRTPTTATTSTGNQGPGRNPSHHRLQPQSRPQSQQRSPNQIQSPSQTQPFPLGVANYSRSGSLLQSNGYDPSLVSPSYYNADHRASANIDPRAESTMYAQSPTPRYMSQPQYSHNHDHSRIHNHNDGHNRIHNHSHSYSYSHPRPQIVPNPHSNLPPSPPPIPPRPRSGPVGPSLLSWDNSSSDRIFAPERPTLPSGTGSPCPDPGEGPNSERGTTRVHADRTYSAPELAVPPSGPVPNLHSNVKPSSTSKLKVVHPDMTWVQKHHLQEGQSAPDLRVRARGSEHLKETSAIRNRTTTTLPGGWPTTPERRPNNSRTAIVSSNSPSSVTSSPADRGNGTDGATRCSGYTKSGQPCKRVVKNVAPIFALSSSTETRAQGGDEEGGSVVEEKRFCKDHVKSICAVEGFYWKTKRGNSGTAGINEKWVEFASEFTFASFCFAPLIPFGRVEN